MRQFLEIKARYPNTLVLFRMGDFYETFFEDAVLANRLIGITLTKRGKDPDGNPIPMAGVPFMTLDQYIARLVRLGESVVVVEQQGTPGKGMLERKISRIVTPGTLTDTALLPQQSDSVRLSVAPPARRGQPWGFAWLTRSSGEFRGASLKDADLETALSRISPSEVLIPEGTNITSLQADDDFFGKSVIAPYSLFKLDMQLNTVLDTLDLTNAGIRNVNFSIRGNLIPNQFGIKRLYLPKVADTIYSIYACYNPAIAGCPTNRCKFSINPHIPVAVFIPKSVKHICDRAITAHIVVFERGIQLESLGSKAITARLLVMSDDPRLDDLIDLEASQSPDKYDNYKEYTLLEFELDLGSSLKSVTSSPILLDNAGYLYTKFHLKVPSNDLESLALLLKFSSLQRLRKMFPEGDWQGKLAEI